MIYSFQTSYSSDPLDLLRDSVVDELNSFSNLKEGWDYGIGKPITQHVINRAIEAYLYLKDYFFEYECSPISNNTIQITFSLLDNFLDIVISKGSYSVTIEKGIGSEFDTILILDNCSLENIRILLDNIKNQCFSSGQSISQGIVSENKDLKTASRTWVTASQSFPMIVRSKSRKQRVLT